MHGNFACYPYNKVEPNGWHFADNIFKYIMILLDKKLYILFQTTVNFIPQGINDIKTTLA